MIADHENAPPIPIRAFALTALINAVWINASEVFRYFAFVMPMMREAFPQVQDVAPMNLIIFVRWGVWDTILLLAVTGFVWIYLERFGASLRNALIAGTLVWASIFGILWLGLFNMNLATVPILAVALSLSWLEMLLASLITLWGMNRFAQVQLKTPLGV